LVGSAPGDRKPDDAEDGRVQEVEGLHEPLAVVRHARRMTWGQCYDNYFRRKNWRFSAKKLAIFGEKLAIFGEKIGDFRRKNWRLY
jgi:hypothetical protein